MSGTAEKPKDERVDCRSCDGTGTCVFCGGNGEDGDEKCGECDGDGECAECCGTGKW